jgi:hypothetical protein
VCICTSEVLVWTGIEVLGSVAGLQSGLEGVFRRSSKFSTSVFKYELTGNVSFSLNFSSQLLKRSYLLKEMAGITAQSHVPGKQD